MFDNDGNYFYRQKKVRTLPHLLFVLKYTAKYIGKQFDAKQVQGWEHVKPAFKVRDRITHPGTPSALKISDDDFQHVEALEQWLQGCFAELTAK